MTTDTPATVTLTLPRDLADALIRGAEQYAYDITRVLDTYPHAARQARQTMADKRDTLRTALAVAVAQIT